MPGARIVSLSLFLPSDYRGPLQTDFHASAACIRADASWREGHAIPARAHPDGETEREGACDGEHGGQGNGRVIGGGKRPREGADEQKHPGNGEPGATEAKMSRSVASAEERPRDQWGAGGSGARVFAGGAGASVTDVGGDNAVRSGAGAGSAVASLFTFKKPVGAPDVAAFLAGQGAGATPLGASSAAVPAATALSGAPTSFQKPASVADPAKAASLAGLGGAVGGSLLTFAKPVGRLDAAMFGMFGVTGATGARQKMRGLSKCGWQLAPPRRGWGSVRVGSGPGMVLITCDGVNARDIA